MTTPTHDQTVLVAIDRTAACGAAVRWAAVEASRRGARLHAVHVVDLVDRLDAGLGADPALEVADARRTIPGRVARAVSEAGVDVDIAVSIVSGDVTDRLAAEARDASLVVLGAPDGPRHTTLAPDLTLRCLCPVAVVTEDGEAQILHVPDRGSAPAAGHVRT